jgi:hypothetical protein
MVFIVNLINKQENSGTTGFFVLNSKINQENGRNLQIKRSSKRCPYDLMTWQKKTGFIVTLVQDDLHLFLYSFVLHLRNFLLGNL